MEMTTAQIADIAGVTPAAVLYFMTSHGYIPAGTRYIKSRHRPCYVYSEDAYKAAIEYYRKASKAEEQRPAIGGVGASKDNSVPLSPELLPTPAEMAKNTENIDCYASVLNIIAQRQIFMEGLLLELVSQLTGKGKNELMRADFAVDDGVPAD